ncbi:hypothetical protein ACFODL_04240 [Phenylobacterium terrae]|uniref:SclB protein n=1 Tax=Phenylobacterium terrae TaxID=2665495 RepID=A0ABW4MVU9_9CAUL
MSNPSTGGVDPGTQPSGAASGTGAARDSGTDRSFDPAGEREPGVPAGDEGGGAMSGRRAEQGGGWREQAKDAHESAARNRPDAGLGHGASGGRHVTGSMSAGDAADRSVDVGGSPGAVPDDLPRRPGRAPDSGETDDG